jgi:signal transduction histidine kinase
VSALSNPRFGIDRTVGTLMGQLRAFYAADTCLLVWGDPAAGTYYLRRVEKSDPEAAARAGTIPADLGHMLLALPEGSAVIYNSKLRVQDWWRMGTSYRAYDVLTGAIVAAGRPESEAIAATLDTRAFVSVPVLFPREGPGRLYVTANRKGFDSTDADFLLQVVQHVTPVLENVRLVDRLAWDAAEEERRKIARDLHDSVVQPYIGLQMGLAALRQKAGASPGTDLGPSIDRLLRFTEDGIADLRGYVHGLKSGGEAEGDLLTALRRYTSRFAEATNIDVQVDSTAPVHLNGRLAAEVFQMVAEGLSNVRRHTNATQAAVRLSQQNGHLILRLENENLNGTDLSPFTPRSIGERATALGGNVRVEQRDGSTTSVVVEIPL